MSVFSGRVTGFCAAIFILLVSASAAPAIAKDDERISAREKNKITAATAILIEDNYHDAEKAKAIADALREASETQVFAKAETKVQYAAALTEFLHPHDGHFAVIWTNGEETPDHHDANWDKVARRTNFGFEKVEILSGNVGYIRMRSFEAPKISAKTAAAAMGMVANADALILDLTNNGGGEPETVQLMLSYLFDTTPRQVGAVYWRENDQLRQYWTLPVVPGERFLDRPLYVLGGAGTASAAEMFMVQIRNHERGDLIGQRTYGAGNPGGVFKPTNEFEVFISNGGPVRPQDIFDGVGVAPDLETPTGEELSRALLLAWDAILETAKDPLQINAIDWAQARLKAELDPQPLSDDDMQGLAGDFGDRQIVIRDGRLIYERGRRAPEFLIAAGDDVFFLQNLPGIKIELLRNKDNDVTQMNMTWQDGHKEEFPRRDL